MSANEPAYPVVVNMHQFAGLTKRELFAMEMMKAQIVAGADTEMRGYEGWRDGLAIEAIRYADALLTQLATVTNVTKEPT